jgi:hypothetical protein
MKTLIKLALGAAIAGALVNLLRARREPAQQPASDMHPEDWSGENAEWGGGSSGLNA